MKVRLPSPLSVFAAVLVFLTVLLASSLFIEMVKLRIEAWKKRFGEDVAVTMRYVAGSYYFTKPVKWFGETKRFRVGPCTHVDDVLRRLTQLHSVG